SPSRWYSTTSRSTCWACRRATDRRAVLDDSRAVVDGELDEVVVGIADVHTRRRAPRARPRPGTGLRDDIVALQEREHLVERALPFEAEIGATDRGPSRAEIVGPPRRIRCVRVDLLRVVDSDRRHVWPA